MMADGADSRRWAAARLAALDEVAEAYAGARRLVFDFLTPDALDWLLLTEQQRQALRRLKSADARLKQLRSGSQVVGLHQRLAAQVQLAA